MSGAANLVRPDASPLSDFQEGQWWVAELDAMAQAPEATHQQKRAVSVVHHLLRVVANHVAVTASPVVTDDMRSAVRFAPSSAYWSGRLREFFGPDARIGIDALEAQIRGANPSPQAMAEQFWAMPNTEQVAFFEHLARVIQEDHKTNTSAYSMGELQWHWVAAEMKGNQLARDMLQTMAAPLYLHTLRAAEGMAA